MGSNKSRLNFKDPLGLREVQVLGFYSENPRSRPSRVIEVVNQRGPLPGSFAIKAMEQIIVKTLCRLTSV